LRSWQEGSKCWEGGKEKKKKEKKEEGSRKVKKQPQEATVVGIGDGSMN